MRASCGAETILRMTATGSYEHLRPSALALLADGNSIESVGRVLGIPGAVLMRWRDAPPGAAHDATTARPRSPRASSHPMRFGTTLTFGAPLLARAASFGMALLVVVIVVPTLYRLTMSRFEDGLFTKVALILFVAIAFGAGVARLLCTVQTRLILGPDAIIAPRLLGCHVLPYAELADYWLVMHIRTRRDEDGVEEIEGRLLSLFSRRPGVRPIEVFIRDDEPLDARIVERLDEVKRANQGVQPLTRMRDIPMA